MFSPPPKPLKPRFYFTLERANLAAMMDVWEASNDIVCIHPLGPRLTGREAVRQGWAAIFASATPLKFQVDPAPTLYSGELAIRMVQENILLLGAQSGQTQRPGTGHQHLPAQRTGLAPVSASCLHPARLRRRPRNRNRRQVQRYIKRSSLNLINPSASKALTGIPLPRQAAVVTIKVAAKMQLALPIRPGGLVQQIHRHRGRQIYSPFAPGAALAT